MPPLLFTTLLYTTLLYATPALLFGTLLYAMVTFHHYYSNPLLTNYPLIRALLFRGNFWQISRYREIEISIFRGKIVQLRGNFAVKF